MRPLRDDDGARARRLDLGQVVRREEDRALLADLLQVVEKLGLLVRVEVARRLVEDEDRRVVDERLREADALAVAVRQVPDLLAEHLREAAHLDDALARACWKVLVVEVPEVGGELQVLEHAHLEVERRALRQVAEALAHLERLVEDVVAVDPRRPAGRRDEAREDAHRGRLAGAVWAEKADDFAAPNLEVDLVERAERPEALGQVVRVDHHVGGHPASEPENAVRANRWKMPGK